MPTFVFAHINHRYLPIDRGEVFEDPLQERLEAEGLGEVTGGGTSLGDNGEIAWIGIDVEITDVERGLPVVIGTLVAHGAPKGSLLEVHDVDPPRTVAFGGTEGIAVYLDGVGLPDEVYATSDFNFVVAEVDRLCEGVGRFEAHWQGPTETALYVFGRSADALQERLAPLLASYPLCQGARVVRIA